MRYRSLGRTGIKVSPYALGAMMFGAIGNPDHDESIRIIHRALDAGINLVDTADMYSHGESEQIVGKALRDRRADVVLATKARMPMGDDPNHQGASRRWLVRALEDSLRRLGTDYVDLYQVHRPDPDTDLEETLAALTDLQRAGKVRAFGISSLPASEIVRAHWVSERRGLARLRTEQPVYSILNRGIEREVLPVAQEFGMGT
ncbi:MAG TPA: aldo/keto reductase, partial [Jatrophihabitantaceae bacterium]